MDAEMKKIQEEVRAELNLAIDENNLLNEWKGQAALMLDYGIRQADAMQEEDEARAQLDVVKAQLDREIRSNPEEYGLEKTTETAVANAILEQPGYLVALRKLNTARYQGRIMRAAVDALSHRKSTLQGMTDLFLRQWYSDPKSDAQPVELRDAAKSENPMKVIPGRRRRRAGGRDSEMPERGDN